MSTFDIFTHITRSKIEPPPQNGATDLIKFLVDVVAKDACQAKRNPITSYTLVEIVRDIRDAIDTLIREVHDSSDALDDGIWTKFDNYSSAITPLEE